MTAPAPAKVNLGLHILRRRPDGYHDIETGMLRIDWHDTVTVEAAAALSMTTNDPTLPTDASNLCMKAAVRLQEFIGRKPGAKIHLEKRVPYGAGLGGGSSDAATTLTLLCKLWSAVITRSELAEIAARVGSDVPFFLGTSVAVATGRGEILRPVRDEAGRPLELPHALVVVYPPVVVSTAEAYAMVKPSDAPRPSIEEMLKRGDLAEWRAHLVNDFQQPIVDAYPAIGSALGLLEDAGAGYTSLSGSGSAVFGVFDDAARARAAHQAASQAGLRSWTNA
jgi:4-diphosphocytidyl-2-C-methyl-D-erythritol kinase